MSKLLQINVNEKVERKNGLSYLSWAWAWSEVLKIDPQATWEAVEFSGLPFLRLPDDSAMVKVVVTISGHAKSCLLPVMDHRNKAIKGPDAFQINTAIMRCMTKAISMHGLGLYIYAGEDLPEGEEPPKSEKTEKLRQQAGNGASTSELSSATVSPDWEPYLYEVATKVTNLVASGDISGAAEELDRLADVDGVEAEHKVFVWSKLDSKSRSAIKAHNAKSKQATA